MRLADAADDSSDRSDRDTSVGKALVLLSAFEGPALVLGVTELARKAGIPKSTAFRLLLSLEKGGFVERRGTGYSLSRRLFELGSLVSYCRPRNLRDVALPFLSELYERSHETVHLAVLDDTDVLYVEKLFGHNKVRSPSHVGKRVPAHCAGLGKAMLAYSEQAVIDRVLRRGLTPRTPYTIVVEAVFRAELQKIRDEGVAYDREEASIGLVCVAAPVLSVGGDVVAAVSVSGPPTRYDPLAFARSVRRAADGIAAGLGLSGTHTST